MLSLLTSCGRFDLLQHTVDSLLKNQQVNLFIDIHEDSNTINFQNKDLPNINVVFTGGRGQHASIERFLNRYPDQKHYLHLEDDWEFNNDYNWIERSLEIMKQDPSVIKVLCRENSPHPCKHDVNLGYGYIHPWQAPDGTVWHGFSWNPGVTRLDLLKQFIPFPKWEQELAANIFNAGYKVVELIKPVYKHIGDGRSTHE
jgi:hypothetical protein